MVTLVRAQTRRAIRDARRGQAGFQKEVCRVLGSKGFGLRQVAERFPGYFRNGWFRKWVRVISPEWRSLVNWTALAAAMGLFVIAYFYFNPVWQDYTGDFVLADAEVRLAQWRTYAKQKLAGVAAVFKQGLHSTTGGDTWDSYVNSFFSNRAFEWLGIVPHSALGLSWWDRGLLGASMGLQIAIIAWLPAITSFGLITALPWGLGMMSKVLLKHDIFETWPILKWLSSWWAKVVGVLITLYTLAPSSAFL